MDPDQTAPVGAVESEPAMFASLLSLNRHFQMQLFCWRFKDLIMTEVVTQYDTVTFEKNTPPFQLLPMPKVG